MQNSIKCSSPYKLIPYILVICSIFIDPQAFCAKDLGNRSLTDLTKLGLKSAEGNFTSGIISDSKLHKPLQDKITYKKYVNRSRGFQIEYPSDLIMGAPSANSDGRAFNSPDEQITMVAYSHVSLGEGKAYGVQFNDNLDVHKEIEDISNYVTVTYKVIKSKWFILSGINKRTGKIYYQKTYFSDKHDEYRTFIIKYPWEFKNKYDDIIPRIIKSFKDI